MRQVVQALQRDDHVVRAGGQLRGVGLHDADPVLEPGRAHVRPPLQHRVTDQGVREAQPAAAVPRPQQVRVHRAPQPGRKQVLKQADLVLALHVRGDAFSLEQKRRDFDYDEGLTVRDSSLSACTQAVVAAEVGHLALAHAYAREAGLVDLRNLRDQIDDGLHLASLAGTWLALVCGFGACGTATARASSGWRRGCRSRCTG